MGPGRYVRRLRDFSIGAAEVSGSAIGGVEPVDRGYNAHQSHRTGYGVLILRGLYEGGARGRRTVPAGEETGLVVQLFVVGRFVHDVLRVLDGAGNRTSCAVHGDGGVGHI